MALSTQTNYVSVILQLQKKQLNYQVLENWLSVNANLWAYATHDKDLDDDGTPKGTHVHIKFILNTDKRPRLSTTLNELCRELDFPKDAFTIDHMESVAKSIQYLIHKNDLDKYQYDEDAIHTNLNQKELNTYLYAENDEITTDSLIDVCCKNYRSKIAILKSIGLRYYSKYRGVIADICDEYYHMAVYKEGCERSTIAHSSHSPQMVEEGRD